MLKNARLRAGLLFLLLMSAALGGQWKPQQAPTQSRLRAVNAVNASVAWASGNHGTYARTLDGGASWQVGEVPGASSLDFRDVHALDAHTAWLLSIGQGEQSRIYKTTDGGRSWKLQFTNTNPKGFFDCMAFWDVKNGMAFSDPVDGRIPVILTTDGGAQWQWLPSSGMPPAVAGEAAFAASGTSIVVEGKRNVWIGTGGAAARVFRSTDRGRSWEVAATPIMSGNASSGIFSVAFKDARNGVIAGGDYRKEKETGDNFARTTDGGRNWKLGRPLPGFRSAIAYVAVGKRLALVAVGPSGADYSLDDGESWIGMGSYGFHALSSTIRAGTGWAVGENGLIARLDTAMLLKR
jgi:photosystem II stability/assembly factor-like uncharacterized protein